MNFEKDIVRRDVEQMLKEKDLRRARKHNMAITLRETLIKQAEDKRDKRQQARQQEAQFKYSFPFVEELDQPFLISPKKYHDLESIA
jgi:hypothetical protein